MSYVKTNLKELLNRGSVHVRSWLKPSSGSIQTNYSVDMMVATVISCVPEKCRDLDCSLMEGACVLMNLLF